MKKISLTYKTLGRLLMMSAVVVVALSVGSCTKDKKHGIAPSEGNPMTPERSAKVHNALSKVLRGFVTAQAGGSNQQSFAANGGMNFSNVTMSTTTKSDPMRSVTTWSDPTTPTTVYSFSDASSSGGGGLGQLSYNGKSFDYNFALSITIAPGTSDPTWGMSAGTFGLHMIAAIDGDMGSSDFTLRNVAFFLVAGDAIEGSIELGDYSGGATHTIGIGELIDLSAVATPTPAMMDQGKFYYTTSGHMNVSATTFEMGSDAKITDAVTGAEYSIEGALMSE